MLDEYLDFYKCWDLYPFAERIFWLNDVREAVGYIPDDFNLSRQEIVGLTAFMQEKRLHEASEMYKSKQQASATPRSAPPSSS